MLTASALGIALAKNFKKEILSIVKDIKDEASYFFDSGLPSYIESQYSKYALTKTFIHRNEPVDFYQTYFPITIQGNKERVKLDESSWDIFEKSNCVGVVGQAGSGKSMLMKFVYLNTVQTYIKIPIVIELRNINDFDGSIVDYIYKVIFNNRLSPNKKILERLLDTGSFLFLFDGYDELSLAKKEVVTDDIDQFIDRYSKNYYIVTSRPEANLESIPRFYCYNVCSLSYDEIIGFINKQSDGSSEYNTLSKKIITTIAEKGNEQYRHYLQNPLLLSMFIITYNNYPQLPKYKSKFYWNVFDTLCTKHDSITKKGGYQHERKTKLQNDEIEQILKWLCYQSYFESKIGFDREYLFRKLKTIKQGLGYKYSIEDLVYDLTVSVSIIVVDGLEYKLPHKSMHEYFVASLIKDQNDDDKKKIYNSKMRNVNMRAINKDFNLLGLCMEMDKASFVKDFLLFNLKPMQSQFLKYGISHYALEFAKKFEMSYVFIFSNNKKQVRLTESKISYGLELVVCEFLEIEVPIHLDFDSSKDTSFFEKAKDLGILKLEARKHDIKNNLLYYRLNIDKYSGEKGEVQNKILESIGHFSNIESFVNLLSKKIEELERDVEGEVKSTTSLLGI
ncbi:MAG TPA: NACHT domain-containing protein [Chitinophagales bacterium]|nr:NACHT domain-containing protein [Chitinophagales bacterium]